MFICLLQDIHTRIFQIIMSSPDFSEIRAIDIHVSQIRVIQGIRYYLVVTYLISTLSQVVYKLTCCCLFVSYLQLGKDGRNSIHLMAMPT